MLDSFKRGNSSAQLYLSRADCGVSIRNPRRAPIDNSNHRGIVSASLGGGDAALLSFSEIDFLSFSCDSKWCAKSRHYHDGSRQRRQRVLWRWWLGNTSFVEGPPSSGRGRRGQFGPH